MADKIMRAEAIISAKDGGFTSTLSRMGAALKHFGRTANSVAGLSARDAEKMARVSRRNGGMGMAAAYGGVLDRIGAVAAPGALAAYGASKIVMAGARAQHERLRMQAAGMTQKEIEEANDEALKLAEKIPNFDQTTIMHALRNARTIVGSYQEAAEIMEPLLRMRASVEAAHPGVDMTEEFDKFVKGLEIKGVTQHMDEFRSYMQSMTKTLNVFGDTLRPSEYYEMFKLGRQSTRGLSQQYISEVAPTLAQELGGPQAGTAQQAFFNAIVGGHMSKTALRQMVAYGLVDPSMVVSPKGGHLAQVKPGGIRGSDLAMVNPYEWVNQILLPALAKKGIVDPDKIQEVIASLFSKATAAQLVSIFATQQARIMKDAALARGALGMEAADEFNKKSGSVAFGNMKTQAMSAMQEIGRDLADNLAPQADEAARALAGFTKRLHENSEASKKGETTPGQKTFNALADKVRNDLFGGETPEDSYRSAIDPMFARLEAMKAQIKKLEAEKEGAFNQSESQMIDSELRPLLAQFKALGDQARDLIDVHDAAQEAAQALRDFSTQTFNHPWSDFTPRTAGPKGFAAFPMSKTSFAGFDANGAPIIAPPKAQTPSRALDLKEILTGKIEAKLDGRVPVDVTGKVALEGKADVRVKVSVEGQGRVTGLGASSSGNIRANVGATMPDAGKPKR